MSQSAASVHCTTWLSVIVGISCLLLPASPATGDVRSPEMAFGYCTCTFGEYRYYSAAFSSPADQYTHWRQAFLKFLQEKYQVQGFIQCARYASQAESQKDFDSMIGLARKRPPGWSVETGWVYTSTTLAAAAPAAAPAPAAPSGPVTTPAARPAPAPASAPVSKPAAQVPTPAAVASVHAVCWADSDPTTRYYSAVFSGAGSDYGDWMPAFQQFLQQRYQYRSFVRCAKKPTQSEAQQYRDQMVGSSRGVKLPGGGTPKIIETGWTFKRPG